MDFQNNYKKYLDKMNQAGNENMTEKEMQELQEAIDNSKASADLEKIQREHSEQEVEIQKKFYKTNTSNPSTSAAKSEKPFRMKQWSKQPKSADIRLEKEVSSTPRDFKLTFQDFLEASSKSLDVVYHPPIFNLPVTTNSVYQKYATKTRAKLLFNYFTKLEKLRAKIARKSIYRAPFSKPIQLNDDDNNGNFDDFFADSTETQDVYVSRAGRQVKRKIYTEEIEADSDPDSRGSLIKKNKSDELDLKITLDNPYIPEEKPLTPRGRKGTQKQLSLSTRKAMNRSEEMFDKLVQNEDKRKQQEDEIEKFHKSLPQLSDDENIGDSPVKEVPVEVDENVFPRRVPPPKGIPAKRGGRGRKATKQELKEKNDSPPVSPMLVRQVHTNKSPETKPKSRLQKGKEATSKMLCPICDKEFPVSTIANHAATCGTMEEDTLPSTFVPNRNANKTIRCDLCKKHFPESEYVDHYKKCLAETVMGV